MPLKIIALGADKGPRQAAFAAACRAVLGAPPIAVSYADFLAAPDILSNALTSGDYLWIDSPHQDVASITALYRAGAADAETNGYPVLPDSELDTLAHGAIGSPAQFYFGLVAAVSDACERAAQRGASVSVTVPDVESAFDKTHSWERLNQRGVAIPDSLGNPATFDQLTAEMDAAAISRVFVKLRHGSAAAGMIALARNGQDWRAVTTAMPTSGGSYTSSRNVQTLTDLQDIKTLIDTLGPLGLHVERWLPKYGIDAKCLDVRCVVVDGETIFPVVRASRHPMTNLHLGGARSSPDALIGKIGQPAWTRALASVRTAAQAYAGCKSVGIDLAILAGGTKHAILEVNAFGDFVKDVHIDGLSPYEMILKRLHTTTGQGHAA